MASTKTKLTWTLESWTHDFYGEERAPKASPWVLGDPKVSPMFLALPWRSGGCQLGKYGLLGSVVRPWGSGGSRGTSGCVSVWL
jgi:hypothetical protein